MRTCRRIVAGDRPALHELLVSTAAFQPHEIDVAMELIDIVLARPGQQDYHSCVLLEDGAIVAYACFGLNPLTRSTYDLYWLATHASALRRGCARELFHRVEGEIERLGGRRVIVEASSKEKHRGTHAFYARIGCELVARLPDFYDEGDDQLIFIKQLAP